MTAFHIQNRLALKPDRPITIIADADRLPETLDIMGICGDVRAIADNFLSQDKDDHIQLYKLSDGKSMRMDIIRLKPCKSRTMPRQNVFQLEDRLKRTMIAEDGAVFYLAPCKDSTDDDYLSLVGVIARTYPLYTRKTDDSRCAENVDIISADLLSQRTMERLQAAADTMQLTAKLVDTPTLEMTCEDFDDIMQKEAEELGLQYRCISGTALLEEGFGGIYHVGKSGITPPRLIILSYCPSHARRSIALVGKGIVYDTGGLCLKPRDHMATMKSDMGGAAAVFGAIRMAALEHLDIRVTALLCVAENGIGPNALRPDDIIRLHSGLTVEINNTDAEGRLVIADGVSYASKEAVPDYIIDMATLTGAQLMCTGKRHAGLLTPDDEVEKMIVEAGKACGEPVFPLIYAPDLLFSEFRSDLADMKNSCKDRLNAQSSCAGHFVEKHLAKSYKGKYAHIDIAGPAWSGERSTAYGVLLLENVMRRL